MCLLPRQSSPVANLTGAFWLMLISDKHIVQFFHNAVSFLNQVIISNEQLKIAL